MPSANGLANGVGSHDTSDSSSDEEDGEARAAAAAAGAAAESAGGAGGSELPAAAGVDVYDDAEPDPAKCRALESSLWELTALRAHYDPLVTLHPFS